jgi:hypothetical protein
MPKFIVERDMPNVGTLSDSDFQVAARQSCDVLRTMGPEVQWIHSYVTGDKIYCVYHAADESLIRAHAERSGFPANRIHKVERVIDPATAEAA